MEDAICVQSFDPETIKFYEKLAEAVRKFPCLYDKTCKEYKDKFVVANAWAKVAENLNLLEGERAKKLFENLKKRFSKRRNDFKKVNKSGTSLSAVVSTKAKLEEYNFLQWLVPYIKARATKTNLSLSTICSSSTSNGSFLTDDEIEHSSQVNEDTDCQEVEADEIFDDKSTDISATTGHKKWSKMKVEHEEIKFLRTMQKAIEHQTKGKNVEQDESDLFGMLVASQLKKLNAHEQAIARHQIQNVLFNMQMNQNTSPSNLQQLLHNTQATLPFHGSPMMQNPTN